LQLSDQNVLADVFDAYDFQFISQTGQADRVRSDSIRRTVLQTVAEKKLL